MTSIVSSKLAVGRRYINTKNRQPLTLLYIGPLPPNNDATNGSGPSSTPTWLGVEYDDPSHGKGHSGTYKGIQIFQTKQPGSGAFIRLKTGNELHEGKTFVEAINERYALQGEGMESVVLGSSNAIIVEAPGMEGVSKRLRTLEKLRQIGLEDELICGVGGTEEERADLAARLKGVKMLNISRNLMSTWEEVEGILEIVSGVTTLIMKLQTARSKEESRWQIKELHLARSLVTWSDVNEIIYRFNGLEELHLSGNAALAESPTDSDIRSDTLKVLSLDECGITLWAHVEVVIKNCTSLETLNPSSNPLGPISDFNDNQALVHLKNLILLSTPLDSLASLVNLSNRLPHLENLRFSLAPSPTSAGASLSGNAEDDRGTLLVIFPELRTLNGNEVRNKEREEAERRFCSRHSAFEEVVLQGLLEELSKKHGIQQVVPTPVQNTSLRSKMITLHLYPSSTESFTIPVLPSAPISMIKRKITKKLGMNPDDVKLWTMKRIQGDDMDGNEEVWKREKVMEVGEGEVGFWFDDGDGIMVETA